MLTVMAQTLMFATPVSLLLANLREIQWVNLVNARSLFDISLWAKQNKGSLYLTHSIQMLLMD